LKTQASQLAQGARQMADAVGSSFSDAVAHTSLIGAVILGVGTVLVAVLLPGKGRGGGRTEGEAGTAGTESAADVSARSVEAAQAAEASEFTRTGR
jgi:hypothetical protein